MPVQTTQSQTLDSVYLPVVTALGRLFRRVTDGGSFLADFDDVIFLLETLPLATDEFGIARLRLLTAKGYRSANEIGAASWEIRTVMQQLRGRMTAKAAEPRRRARAS